MSHALAQVLLLTSSAERLVSVFCPSPSTMRSSSWDVLECDIPPEHDSVWNWTQSKQSSVTRVKKVKQLTG